MMGLGVNGGQMEGSKSLAPTSPLPKGAMQSGYILETPLYGAVRYLAGQRTPHMTVFDLGWKQAVEEMNVTSSPRR